MSLHLDETGTAEDLIKRNAASRPSTVRVASMLPVNEEETKSLVLGDITAVNEGANVIGAAVRGDYLVTVEELPNGQVVKAAQAHTSGFQMPEAPAEEEVARLEVERDAKVQQAVREARQDAEEQIAAAREQAQTEIQQIREEAATEIEAAQQRAAAEEGQPAGASAQSQASSPAAEKQQQEKSTSGSATAEEKRQTRR
jgi:hypothetical protein